MNDMLKNKTSKAKFIIRKQFKVTWVSAPMLF